MLTLVEPVEFFPAYALEQETQKPTAIRARLALAGLGAKTGQAMGGLSGPCSLASVRTSTATSFAGMRLHPQLSKHAWQKYKCKFCTPATFRRTNVIELPNGISLKAALLCCGGTAKIPNAALAPAWARLGVTQRASSLVIAMQHPMNHRPHLPRPIQVLSVLVVVDGEGGGANDCHTPSWVCRLGGGTGRIR